MQIVRPGAARRAARARKRSLADGSVKLVDTRRS